MKTVFNYTRIMFVAMAAMAVFTSCTKNEDDYIASSLRSSDWQGKITEYYQNRWGINGSEYSTVMGFESKDYHYTSGRGYELDYKTSSPKENYAFCTFKWFIVDGDITIIYDDDKWNPTYIVDYQLRGNSFYGYIYNASDRRVVFQEIQTHPVTCKAVHHGNNIFLQLVNPVFLCRRRIQIHIESLPGQVDIIDCRIRSCKLTA